MIAGRSSDGYEFVFVELEAPTGNITARKTRLGDVFRKGLYQIEDWQVWLQKYDSLLKETFNKSKNPNLPLPEEFDMKDETRFHFVVIAGRRDDFNNEIYRTRREKRDRAKIRILHYDNLVDAAESVIGGRTY